MITRTDPTNDTFPPVSVLVTTFNYARYIREAIESVLKSDYPAEQIQIVVVDDGSTDNTREIIEGFGPRVQYVFQQNRGKAAATASGLKEVAGKYCFFLDADDYYLPDRIRRAVELFEGDSELVHVSHPALYRKEGDGAESEEAFPAELRGRRHAGSPLLCQMFSENYTVGAGSTFSARVSALRDLVVPEAVDMFVDEYLLIHTLPRGDSYFHDRPLSVWRIHGDNYSDIGAGNNALIAEKEERTLQSMRAVLKSLGDDSPALVREIYSLKLFAAELHTKERSGSKSFSDVLKLAVKLGRALPTIGGGLFQIAARYHWYSRLIPTSLLRVLKR
jgi:glycosyltransferase involved in cell wall biosynthesis